ncbi:MAG: hemerythrin domain-containing protein [Chromatiaceae bacterium]|jgi:hemerythrin|nr:hemerythrin domain-containing protein [Chromatiaceae bacterium]
MVALVWRDAWLLGIEPLDADHRKMVALLNAVLCDAGAESGEIAAHRETQTTPIGERMQALIDHLRDHFVREETFLEAIEYPGFEQHKGEHALEMAELVDVARSHAERGAPCVGVEAADGIKRWFFDHVIAEDRRFARYYHERLGAREAML